MNLLCTSPIAHCRLPIADCRLQIADCPILSIIANVKTSFHITTESLPSNEEMIMLIEAGQKFCSYGRVEKETLSLVEFAQFEADHPDEQLLSEVLKKLSADSTAVSYWTTEAMVIPTEYFRLQDVPLHLNLLNGNANDHSIHSELISKWDVHNVYRMSPDISGTIERKFNSRNQWHHYTVTLRNLLPDAPGGVYVDFRTDEFSVVVTSGQKLLLAQVYTYTTPEDVLFYLLKIFRELGLSQKETRIYLSGFVDENSAVMRELHKYFLNMHFEALSGGITLPEPMLQYPSHFFNAISKLGACVLSVEP